MKAALVTIGNEILLGRTLNTNMAFIGERLAEIGVPLTEERTVRDEPAAIRATLADLWPRFDVVITTGGLGPTKDDLTKQTIADFFGKGLHFDDRTWARVQERFARRGLTAVELNRNQAMVPDNFDTLDNDHGTAPGLAYTEAGHLYFALPGVPHEMRALLTDRVIPRLLTLPGLSPVWVQTLHTSGIPESTLAEQLADIEVPQGVELAWLPQPGQVSLRVHGTNHMACNALFVLLQVRLGDEVWGMNDDTPASRLHELLTARSLSLALAESCTGGMVSKMLTDLPGSSAYLKGGVVAYANEVKEALLGVSHDTLLVHGAVSEPTARAMAEGARTRLNTDVGLSVTGIAGPEGGTDEKPVGTVHIAVATATGTHHELLRLIGSRENIRRQAADRALLLALRTLRSTTA